MAEVFTRASPLSWVQCPAGPLSSVHCSVSSGPGEQKSSLLPANTEDVEPQIGWKRKKSAKKAEATDPDCRESAAFSVPPLLASSGSEMQPVEASLWPRTRNLARHRISPALPCPGSWPFRPSFCLVGTSLSLGETLAYKSSGRNLQRERTGLFQTSVFSLSCSSASTPYTKSFALSPHQAAPCSTASHGRQHQPLIRSRLRDLPACPRFVP